MSAPAAGPIARRILTSIRRLKNRTVVDLAARRHVNTRLERIFREYVFEAYANHETDAIFLVGLPDAPESRPHSRENADW